MGGMRPAAVVAALSFCLIANLAPLMTFPAISPAVAREWGLDATEIGWIGGIYFAGYASAVLVLSSATDRFDGRRMILASSAATALAAIAFYFLADGFWVALVLRLLAGMALAGIHMPGLKLLTDRVEGGWRERGAAIYTSSYALGGAGSFLVAGVVEGLVGWRATFLVAGLLPLAAIVVVTWLPPSARPTVAARAPVKLRRIVTNRPFMAYVVGFAGNTWEVFGVRVWFVTCLAWTLGLPGNEMDLPSPAVVGGLAALASVPASLLVAELALKWNRVAVVVATCLFSVVVCLALAATAGGPILLVLVLLVIVQISSFADVGALGAGAVATSESKGRGMALAIYAFGGYVAAFLGPVAVGWVLDRFGGPESASGWTAAFFVLSLGSLVSAVAVWSARHDGRAR